MHLAQFGDRERRNAVLRHKHPQLVLGVDAPLISAGINQRVAGGLVLAEEDRLPKDLLSTMTKGNLQQCQERRLMRFEDFGKLRRDTVAASKMFV